MATYVWIGLETQETDVASYTGMNTWFAAAADPRIAVAVALIGVQVAILIHISCNRP